MILQGADMINKQFASHLPSLLKTLLLTSTLTLSLMFSAGSSAEWTYMGVSNGNKWYLDFDRIRKSNGLVYYWEVVDLLEPFNGLMSTKTYYKGDCETFREMQLSISAYELPMAEGNAKDTFTPEPRWEYVRRGSTGEAKLKAVCNH
jgi:hypothetical protein